MAIFLTEESKVIVQGMTGSEGQKHTTRMLASGTQVVGGVNPRKAGTSVTFPHGDGTVDVPVFGTVADAVAQTGADVSVIFVPPAFAKDAIIEGSRALASAAPDARFFEIPDRNHFNAPGSSAFKSAAVEFLQG